MARSCNRCCRYCGNSKFRCDNRNGYRFRKCRNHVTYAGGNNCIKHDFEALDETNRIEEEIDKITARMETNHITRLEEEICTPLVGAHYLSLSSNAERVADHLVNVAKTIEEYKS